MKKYAIIVAGGSGSRMGADIPKQFLKLGNQAVLMHTIKAFAKVIEGIEIIVVLPENQIDYWYSLLDQYHFTIKHTIVSGGESRFHSVLNGLNSISNSSNDDLVAVQDGVRPFADAKMIQNAFSIAQEKGNAICAVDCKDSVRLMHEKGNQSVERSKVKLIQTPQVFQFGLIRQAYKQPYKSVFTDDASVLEALNHPIHLVDGSYENIKITTPEDLQLAELILGRLTK